MTRLILALGAALTLGLVGQAQAQGTFDKDDLNYSIFGQAGPWTVYADRKNKVCIAERLYENGAWAMQAVSDKNVSIAQLGVFNTNPKGKVVRRQKVKIDIDGRTFKSVATGAEHKRKETAFRGGYIEVKERAFAEALVAGRTMYVTPRKSDPFYFDITGLGGAVQLIPSCLQQVRG